MNIQLISLYTCQGHFLFIFQNESRSLDSGPRQIPALLCGRKSYAAHVLQSLGSLRDTDSRLRPCCLEFIKDWFLLKGEEGTSRGSWCVCSSFLHNLITFVALFLFPTTCTLHVKVRLLVGYFCIAVSILSKHHERAAHCLFTHIGCLLTWTDTSSFCHTSLPFSVFTVLFWRLYRRGVSAVVLGLFSKWNLRFFKRYILHRIASEMSLQRHILQSSIKENILCW